MSGFGPGMGARDEPLDISGDQPEASQSRRQIAADALKSGSGGASLPNSRRNQQKTPDSSGEGKPDGPSPTSSEPQGKHASPSLGGAASGMFGHTNASHIAAPLLHREAATPQTMWDDVQYWGRAANAFFDPNAINTSVGNMWADDGVAENINRNLTHLVLGDFKGNDPVATSLERANQKTNQTIGPDITSFFTILPAYMTPGLGESMMTSQAPSKIEDLPGAAAGALNLTTFGNVIRHPEEARNPAELEKMGSGVLNGLLMAGSAFGPTKGLAKELRVGKFGAKILSMLGKDKHLPPVHMEPGSEFEQERDPRFAKHYGWYDLKVGRVAPIEEARSTLKKALPELEPATTEEAGDVTKNLGSPDELEARIRQGDYANDQVDYITDNWDKIQRTYKFKAPLDAWHPGEPTPGDARDVLRVVGKAKKSHAINFTQSLDWVNSHINSGLHGHDDDPMGSVFRSLTGDGERVSADVASDYIESAGKLSSKEDRQAALAAVEDRSGESVKSLTHEARAIYDAHREIQSLIGIKKMDLGLIKGVTPFYSPRIKVKAPVDLPGHIEGGASVSRLAKSGKHRVSGLMVKDGQIVVTQRHATIRDANNAVRKAKGDLIAAMKEDHPEMSIGDIKKLADAHLPYFSEDYDEIMGATLARDLKDIHVASALKQMSGWHVKEGGLQLPVVYRPGTDNHLLDPSLARLDKDAQIRELEGRGYKRLTGVASQALVHRGLSEPWNLYAASKSRVSELRALKKMVRFGVAAITADPLVHSWNVIGRQLDFTFGAPMTSARHFAEGIGIAFKSDDEFRQWWKMQQRRYRASGGVMHAGGAHKGAVTAYADQWMHATGDMGVGDPGGHAVVNPKSLASKIGGPIERATSTWGNFQDWFWSKYDHMSTLMFMAEERNGLNRGLNPVQARFWAASRANAWKGAVAPEEWAKSPFMNDMSHLLGFAPNWWRSAAQDITGHYYSVGMDNVPGMTSIRARALVRAVFGMWAASFATSNALNFIMSGHPQWQNQPNNKFKIEMDRYFPVNGDTGAHTVMENPVARQQVDFWKFAGLSAPPEDYLINNALHVGPSPEDRNPREAGKAILSKASPFVSALPTAFNWDLYGTISNGSMQYVDPSSPHLGATPQSLITAAAQFTPLGQEAMQSSESAGRAGATAQKDQFVSSLPTWAQAALGAVGIDTGTQALFSVLGVRAPYQAPEKTQGTGLSTQQRLYAQSTQAEYDQKLLEREHLVAQGKLSPHQWLQTYQATSSSNASTMSSIYHDSPEYKNGAKGVLTRWEALYNDPAVKMDDGDINHVALQQKQDELRAEVMKSDPGGATWDAFQSNLSQEQLKHPMLRLWKDTEKGYADFQDSYARQNGLTGAKMKDELQAYYGAGFSKDRAAYAQAHPEISKYLAAKKQWERTTGPGFMYGLFTQSGYIANMASESIADKYAEQGAQAELPEIGADVQSRKTKSQLKPGQEDEIKKALRDEGYTDQQIQEAGI